jgi:hypothetical protein
MAPDSTVVYDKQFTIVSAPGDAGVMTQIPLFTAPNQPLPPGSYQLTAATADGAAQSAVTVRIR